MDRWFFLFTDNEKYPDPLAEISALHALAEESDVESVYLLLPDRPAPPMSAAREGDEVVLCTRPVPPELLKHGTAVVAADPARMPTPKEVQPLYDELANRWFVPIRSLQRHDAAPVTELSAAEQEQFAKGQACVRVTRDVDQGEPRRPQAAGFIAEPALPPALRAVLPAPCASLNSAIKVIGLDPTAGTWATGVTEGPKPMPAVVLHVRDDGTIEAGSPLVSQYTANASFVQEVIRLGVDAVCIDGPCDTRGPFLNAERTAWSRDAPDGTREAERALAQAGVALFWTTRATVFHFDGASRWIARSLRLFEDLKNTQPIAIETHPHGVFSFLWRSIGELRGPLARKTTAEGREQRLAILQAFIQGLDPEVLIDHDHVDAAAAALVAAFYSLGYTRSFGHEDDGGLIWMPAAAVRLEAIKTRGEPGLPSS